MTTDKPESSNQSRPRRTMSPVLREFQKDRCFQQVKSPGGAYIITGIRPPDPPAPPVEPEKPVAEATGPEADEKTSS